GGDGYLGGVEELGGVVVVDGIDEEAVGDTGDEGVDVGGAGEERHGVAVGFPGVGFGGVIGAVFGAGDGEFAVVGVEAALYGGVMAVSLGSGVGGAGFMVE